MHESGAHSGAQQYRSHAISVFRSGKDCSCKVPCLLNAIYLVTISTVLTFHKCCCRLNNVHGSGAHSSAQQHRSHTVRAGGGGRGTHPGCPIFCRGCSVSSHLAGRLMCWVPSTLIPYSAPKSCHLPLNMSVGVLSLMEEEECILAALSCAMPSRRLASGLILEITVVIMLKRNKRSKFWPYPHSNVCLLCPLLAGGLIPGFAP